jgi:hypothetical protein
MNRREKMPVKRTWTIACVIAILILASLACNLFAQGEPRPAPTPVEQLYTNPLFILLDRIPREPIHQAEDFIYFLDNLALEAAYAAARPPDAETLLNSRDSGDAYTVWWVVSRQTNWLLVDTLAALETMPETVGFSILDVDQALRFGAPPERGLILTGSFDADAVREAYKTNLDYEQNDFDGVTIWCWQEGCEQGMQPNLGNIARENPFGGSLGQRQPMIIRDDMLMASPDLELVLAHHHASLGSWPSLALEPGYRALVNAAAHDAHVLQAILANQAITGRLASRPPIDERLAPEMSSVELDTFLDNYRELPPYRLLMISDAVTADEQIARLGLLYRDVRTADIAAEVLLERLASYQSAQTRLPISQLLAERNVPDPRYYLIEEEDWVTLVMEFPTPKAASEEIIQMVDPAYRGTATRPGMIFRLFQNMLFADDTSWLSTATRAEAEELLR